MNGEAGKQGRAVGDGRIARRVRATEQEKEGVRAVNLG